MKLSVIWFRRDLRLNDNKTVLKALQSENKVLPLFIFDTNITEKLPKNDSRITFIYDSLSELDKKLKNLGSSLKIFKGKPFEIWKKLFKEYEIEKIFAGEDYEPYAVKRDNEIKEFAKTQGVTFELVKDNVIYDFREILKNDGKPYTIYTPYKKKWLNNFKETYLKIENDKTLFKNLFNEKTELKPIEHFGFKRSQIKTKPYSINNIEHYSEERDFPALQKTSFLSPHLRFGTVSIREIVKSVSDNEFFLSELIWREFFMQITANFPHIENNNFNPKYDNIKWINDEEHFEKWKNGKTGFPLVDAGMRELNKTGYMHNRVRMITASFLTKHLLTDWRIGERYFASKLLDYELASNNGNWQWAAGTGCDAAPYFRVFNPETQQKKFDKDFRYILKWVKELGTTDYPAPIVDHSTARLRAIETYKNSFNN